MNKKEYPELPEYDTQGIIEKLNIKEGDIVIVKGMGRDSNYVLSQDLIEKLPSKCIVLFLDEGQTIETLNEEEMEKAGWVRK